MFPEPPRRRKRRRWIYLLAGVVLITALSVGFSNLRSDRAGLREFVDLASVAAVEQEALSAQFRDFLSFEIRGADRNRITALFGSIEETIGRRLAELSILEVPTSGANAEALFNEALEAWLAGASGLEAGLLLAADEPTNPTSTTAIDAALTEVRVGDRLYERFWLSLVDLEEELETGVGNVPLVAYAPASGIVITGDSLVAAVQGSDAVAAFHDIRVGQIELEPGFTGGEHDGVGVLAFTDSVNVSVVVSNDGNLTESDLLVALRVTTLNDGVAIFSEQTTIVTLEPGAARTVDFFDIPVVEGITHEVLAIVNAVVDDVDTANNTATLPFFIQPAS